MSTVLLNSSLIMLTIALHYVYHKITLIGIQAFIKTPSFCSKKAVNRYREAKLNSLNKIKLTSAANPLAEDFRYSARVPKFYSC